MKNLLVALMISIFSGSAWSAGSITSNDGTVVAIPLSSTWGNTRLSYENPTRVSIRFVSWIDSAIDGNAPSESCLTPNIIMGINGGTYSTNVSIPLTSWKDQMIVNNYAYANLSFISGTLTNNCTYSVSGYIKVLRCSDSACAIGLYSAQITIPARQTCIAVVSDVALGNVNRNSTKSASLAITKAGYPAGVVRITGTDIDSSGSLLLGGDADFVVRPSATTYISTANNKGSWVSSSTQSTIPLTVTVGKNATVGSHKSSLTATVTCQ